MSSAITITIRPHWFSAWFLHLAAAPVLLIDGTEHAAAWTTPNTIKLHPGAHEVTAGLRYRGSKTTLGSSTHQMVLRAGETKELVARNGWANHSPFMITDIP